MAEIRQQLHHRFDAEVTALRLEAQISENETALRQAKFDARQSEIALVEYQGSFFRFLNRFSEARRNKESELERNVRLTRQTLDDVTRQRERLELEAEENRSRMEQLPQWETLRRIAMENPETATEFWRLETLYCLTAVQPLLEENHADLTEYGKYLRGEYMGRLSSVEEIAEVQSAPGVSGTECRVWIERLREATAALEIPTGDWAFYDNPKGYIVTAAAHHNRLNLCRDALEQNEDLQRFARRTKEKLEA